jgi:hypothetical protein
MNVGVWIKFFQNKVIFLSLLFNGIFFVGLIFFFILWLKKPHVFYEDTKQGQGLDLHVIKAFIQSSFDYNEDSFLEKQMSAASLLSSSLRSQRLSELEIEWDKIKQNQVSQSVSILDIIYDHALHNYIVHMRSHLKENGEAKTFFWTASLDLEKTKEAFGWSITRFEFSGRIQQKSEPEIFLIVPQKFTEIQIPCLVEGFSQGALDSFRYFLEVNEASTLKLFLLNQEAETLQFDIFCKNQESFSFKFQVNSQYHSSYLLAGPQRFFSPVESQVTRWKHNEFWSQKKKSLKKGESYSEKSNEKLKDKERLIQSPSVQKLIKKHFGIEEWGTR